MEPEIQKTIDFLPIVTSIITGVFTLGAVYLTNKINARNSQKLFEQQVKIESNKTRLLKAEALYVKFEKWSKSFGSVCLKAQYLSQVVKPDELLAKSTENNVDVKGEIIDIKMLIDIYFPELKPHLDEVFKARDLCWDSMQSLTNSPLMAMELEGDLHNFDMLCDELKLKIAELTKLL
ncbi:hypothetical protein [Vibrio cholerae]|uniref:hypothetical protein n=1 Tax=Vibrio cholerae TaxID=666 RepID=UPI003D343638